jgi:LacI family transcriptional regulator
MSQNANNNSRSKARRVTIFDVARESEVSYSTVSRVLNGYEFVKEDTRKRVLETAERLGYVVNTQARSLAGGSSQIIGLLVPGLENGYIGEVVRGIDHELAQADYDVVLYTTHRRPGKLSAYIQKESAYANTIANGMSDGLLLLVPLMPTSYLDSLRERNFPYVLIDQSDSTGQSWTVESTNWQGAYDATRYLIELGHQQIGFITGMMAIHSAIDRLEGYKSALKDHLLPYEEELVAEGDFWQASGYSGTLKFLDLAQPPSAIFASNDLEAYGAMEAIRERGLRIPEDISVIGFDDIPESSITYPKLTTVRQPLEQMGRMAARLLLEQIQNPDAQPRRLTLATQLIVRDSCQAIERG